MEVVLPDDDVMEVESIIFKETSNYDMTPFISEYFIDEEVYKIGTNAAKTYRYFECDSLADQWRFGTESTMDNNLVVDRYNPEVYEDYTETSVIISGATNANDKDTSYSGETRTTRYFVGKWKPLTQKFITEYTDNGYMKIIFGARNQCKHSKGDQVFGVYYVKDTQ